MAQNEAVNRLLVALVSVAVVACGGAGATASRPAPVAAAVAQQAEYVVDVPELI